MFCNGSFLHYICIQPRALKKFRTEGTTLAWAQLFRLAGHAGQRSFARRNFGRGPRTHPKNPIQYSTPSAMMEGLSIYWWCLPCGGQYRKQILTDPADRPDGWRSRPRRRARRGRYRTEEFSCAGTLWVDTPVSPGGNPPRTHVSQGRTKFL